MDVNTCGKKAPESGVKGAGGQYSLFLTPIGPIYWTERNNLSLTRGRDSTSRVEGSASPPTNTCDEKAPESGVKGAGDPIFTGF